MGISAANCAHIFESFVQVGAAHESHSKGNGLGLSIVHALVQAMRGTIDVDSTEGEGTTFVLTLPLPAQQAVSADPPRSELPLEGRHVLLVDDDAINRRVLTAMLQRLDVEVTAVSGGAEALARFSNAFDVILMDCQMPDMDGYQTTRQWRALEREQADNPTPILALTAHSFEDTRHACIEAGMNDMLTKPITVRQLAQELRNALHRERPL